MLETNHLYELKIENEKGDRSSVIMAVWNGEDFYPLQAVTVVDPFIKVRERLNNRVRILQIIEIK